MANDINTHHEQADQIDLTVPAGIVFFIFTAVFTLLVTVPYTIVVPRYFPSPVIAHPHAMLVAETTTAIFWLAGFAAVADLLRRRADLLCDEVGACAATRGSVVVGVFELYVFKLPSSLFSPSLSPTQKKENKYNPLPYWAGG